MPAPKLKDCPRVLVVEGYSDLLFYAECLKTLGKLDGVYIQPVGGKNNLAGGLETFITPTLLAEKTHLGIIVDADQNPAGTFQSIRAIVSERAERNLPGPGIWTDGTPRIGAFVAPGEGREGEIETLVWQSWSEDPANAAPKDCILSYIACMSGAGHTAHSPDKGLVGALLAIRYDDDSRLGPGAREKVFDLARPEFGALRSFLSGF